MIHARKLESGFSLRGKHEADERRTGELAGSCVVHC